MPEHDAVLAVAREWVRKAENDLKTAAHTLGLGDESPTDTVCFHAQQCVEKYLKALLVRDGTDFPKAHDIEVLVHLVSEHDRPTMSAEEMARRTNYATGARYPGWDDVPLAEARAAVAVARRVRDHVRALFPPLAL